MLRRAAVFPLGLVVVAAACGWLYLLRGAVVLHPRVADALPLDELARGSAVPLATFALVWATAALLLGAIARWARLERLVAAIVLALLVGVWQYAAATVSIVVVRQVSAQDALDAASRLEAVYLPAALAAVAGGMLALSRPRRHGAPFVIAALVTVAGGLNLAHTMLPGRDPGLVGAITPDAVRPFTRATGALLGIALLVAARGLARRRKRAWQVAVACAAFSSILHVLHGLNGGTLASTVVLALLVARRHDFDGPGDEATKHLVVQRAAIVVVAVAAYGSAALWLNRMVADQPLSLRFVTREILASALGLHVGGSPHLGGDFGRWYPLSLPLLTVAGTLWVVAGWLAPWRHRVRQDARERGVAHELVRAWGTDTLAPFVLRQDKAYFFTPDERALLAYRVVHGVAIVSGDPIGPPELLPELVASFVRHARERDWRVAVLGVSEGHLDLYRLRGLHALYHGDEAIVDTRSFSLDGRPIRKVRQSVHRLGAAGYTMRMLAPSEIDATLRAELEAIVRDWRGDAPERGFVMALDALFSLGDDDAVFAIGLDPSGRATGFLHFAVSRVGSSLSLSSMPRLACTPNGFNEWLIVEAIRWARDRGYERVSLNFAPFAALLTPEAELTPFQELQRRALLALKGHFQLDNLLVFNRKFFPHWERRFVVYEHRRDLPRVGIAALSAEAYLPFGGRAALSVAAGLVLALASTLALNVGWVVQHDAAGGLSRLELRRPLRALRTLFGHRRWFVGFAVGIGGWALYVGALALAPLSLVQGVSAGGIGLLALLVQRLRGTRLERHEWTAVAISLGGLVLLAASLAGGVSRGAAASSAAVVLWLAVSAVGVALLAGPVARLLAGGAGLGLAAGTLYAAGDVATKAAVGGRWLFVVAVLSAHGAAFGALQLAFQRGNALVTAGLSTLATNALPIVAGLVLFDERFPAGVAGLVRAGAFAATVGGAALLARG